MSFIGVITQVKNEEYVINILSNIFPKDNIFIINNKNISNVKNIHFEIIILDKRMESEELKSIISKAKYLILNADLEIPIKIIQELKLIVITYGFNTKATLTPSSVSENDIIICLQRIIEDKKGIKYEPQEFQVEMPEDIEISSVLATFATSLIYGKSDICFT